jgi:hypothetical protein
MTIYGTPYEFGHAPKTEEITNMPATAIKVRIRERADDWTIAFIRHQDRSITKHLILRKSHGYELSPTVARNSNQEIQLLDG